MLARASWVAFVLTAVVGLGCGRGEVEPTPLRGPPPTPREDVVDVIHGRRVHDPYRWLEDGDDPSVAAWVEGQDHHARAVLATTRHQARLRDELRARWDREAIVGPVEKRGPRYFYGRRHQGRDKVVYYVREGLDGPERVLLDPEQLSPDGSLGIRSIHPSPDGALVAYAVRRNAADAATLHVRDVDTGEDLTRDVIPGARFAWPQWDPDGHGRAQAFYYTGLPDDPEIPPAKLAAHASVRRHAIGTAPEDDAILYGPTGDARSVVAPQLVAGGRFVLLHLFRGAAGAVDVYYMNPARDDDFWPLRVGTGASNLTFFAEDRFMVLTSEGAPHYRVLEIDAWDARRGTWRELVPEREQILDSVAVMSGHLLLSYLDDVEARLVVQRIADGRRWPVELPGPGAIHGVWGDPANREAFVAFSALDREPALYRVPIPDDASTSASLEPFWLPDPSLASRDLIMRRIFARSADGARVPVFVLHREDLALDGQSPTILYGYGGFGISITPGYNPVASLWAEEGGVWAQASLRGGGEYGEAWHRAGTRVGKQRVFDDFLAAGEELVAAGFTSPARLGIMGGSNGGLLVGAASTQRPELFGAVVCMVPLLDMVRYDRFGLGPLWIDEYGTVADPDQFRALHDYSPYHQIRADRRYPPLLMISADSDDRVDPLHARKYVAAMQAVSPASTPILLRTEAQAGHGGADSTRQRVEAWADVLSFLLTWLDPGHGAG